MLNSHKQFPKCKVCRKELSRYNAIRCKSCENKRRNYRGENSSRYGKKYPEHSIKMRGKRNPNYHKISINGDTIIKHHIDMNKNNNDKTNLLFIKQGLHTSLHHKAYNYLVKIGQIKKYIKWFLKYQIPERED